MIDLLNGLKAAGEPSRLRLLALCAQGELTVRELTQILGQSQPRVSRHLKLLCEAGLLERRREATSAFYRLADANGSVALARTLVDLVPEDDPTLALDRDRLTVVKQTRAAQATAYFRANAPRWHEVRALYAPETSVEKAMLDLLDGPIHDLLDVGTGTGRTLELFGERIRSGVGVDLSREMLALARANLERAGLRHCQVRYADMYALPFEEPCFDTVTFHQVLHFADDPARAIAEGGRVLRKGGRLVIADFAPHALEHLRDEHAHRRLGFPEHEVAGWCRAAGLEVAKVVNIAGDPLTVTLWAAHRTDNGRRA